jgi:hypothetical protein
MQSTVSSGSKVTVASDYSLEEYKAIFTPMTTKLEKQPCIVMIYKKNGNERTPSLDIEVVN